tara:strand:+ start:467 stop:586 length:120 start_codon:yes stop_codon:yes gene_type:complete
VVASLAEVGIETEITEEDIVAGNVTKLTELMEQIFQKYD